MTPSRPELPAYVLSALAVVAAVVLLITNHEVPSWIAYVGVGGAVGGAGITVPTRANRDGGGT